MTDEKKGSDDGESTAAGDPGAVAKGEAEAKAAKPEAEAEAAKPEAEAEAAKPEADAREDADADAEAKAADAEVDSPAAEEVKPGAVDEEEVEHEMPAIHHNPAPTGAAWMRPLVKFDDWWTRVEAKLVLYVLFSEIIAMCLWVALKGMSADYRPGGGDYSGLVLRAVLGASVLGAIVNRALRPKDPEDPGQRTRHQVGVTVAVAFGLAASRLWASAGSEYFSNVLNWLQSTSTLTLLGGLRGVATRLTLWVALLGGSLATAQGKHINVDVVMRFLTPKLRVPVAILGWAVAATVCLAGAWGFFDHLAIAEFKVTPAVACADDPAKMCDTPASEKMKKVRHEMMRDFFLTRRQLALDVVSAPRVLTGAKYENYLHAARWNEWMRAGDWEAYFDKDDVAGQMMDESDANATRLPIINIPGSGDNTNGLLIRDLDFVFPFGLLMIALRFLLRCLLAATGWVRVDIDAAHDEEDIDDVHEPHAAKKEGAS